MSAKREDWIQLSVKFRGRCAVCSKEVAAGEIALWSKTAKAIKHISCQQPSTQAKAQHDIKQISHDTREIDCFVCGMASQITVESQSGHYLSDASQTHICDRCASEQGSYKRYQESFLKKMQRIANVKI